MKLRRLAVSLLLCLAPGLAQAAFPALVKWTARGGALSNPCKKIPGTQDCKLYDSAQEAFLDDSANLFCQNQATWFSGTHPFESWNGQARQWDCGGNPPDSDLANAEDSEYPELRLLSRHGTTSNETIGKRLTYLL